MSRSTSSLSLVRTSGRLIIGLRVKRELNAWDLIQAINGLRVTVINDEVGIVILHTPPHIPLLTSLYRDRIMGVVRNWRDYLEPLPNGITLNILENVSLQFTRAKVEDTAPYVGADVPKVLTICRLSGDEVRYTVFLRGNGSGRIEDVLTCKSRTSLKALRSAIEAPLRQSLMPGSMVMTRYYPIDIDLSRHLAILGATGSGKTTLARAIIRNAILRNAFSRVLIFDMTGEYSIAFVSRAYIAIPGIDVGVNVLSLPRHRSSELLAMAIQATSYMYNENNEGFSFIQLEVLEKALERVGGDDLRGLYRALDELEQEFSRRTDYLNAISAVRRRLRKLMIRALMRNTLSSDAAKSRVLVINMAPLHYVSQVASILFILTFLEVIRGRIRDSLVVIDEAHRVLGNYVIGESIIEKLIREGRHDGITLMLITQNPLDLKHGILDIIGHYAVFKLNGRSASEASRLVGVDEDRIIGLSPLEFYYHNAGVTVKSYLVNEQVIDYSRLSNEVYSRILDSVGDGDRVRALIRRFGRALDPVILPQVIDLGLREGLSLRSIVEMAMRKDPEYLRLLSRVIVGED